jgi:PAS domain S-box-containing protein
MARDVFLSARADTFSQAKHDMKSEKKPAKSATAEALPRTGAGLPQADNELEILKKRLAESQRVAAIGSFERDLATGKGFWSDELYRLLGFEPGQVADMRSVLIARLHPDDRAAAMAALARVSGRGGSFNLETRYLTQDGHVRHARFRAVADADQAGKPVRLYGTFQDITDAKLAREALAASEARYKNLVENASVVIHTLDAGGKITYVSPNVAAYIGQMPRRLIGKAMAGLVHESDRERFTAYFDKVMAEGGDAAGVEFRWRREGGGYVWFKTTASRIDDAKGVPAVFLGVARDCTDRILAEEARRDMDLMLQHDMRSPLQGVIQLPQTMAADENLTDRQRRMLGIMSNCGKRMLRLINFSMSMGKLETGLYQPVVQPVDIVAVCREIIVELAERAKAKDVNFDVSSEGEGLAAGEALYVKGDALLCFILFENLLANAMEASPQGAVVDIALHRLEKTALIAIHNLGAVPEALRERFFEKYATFGKPGGTGLGTYSAKLIAENLGGKVSLRTSEAEGTTLAVTLPL